MCETTTNVGVALQDAMREIEKANPGMLYGVFGELPLVASKNHSLLTLNNAGNLKKTKCQ